MRIAVIGAGLMGTQVSLLCAARGHEAVLTDQDPAALERAVDGHRRDAGRMVASHVERNDALARISYVDDLVEALRGADIVVEAIAEDLGLKRALFARLGALADATTILASNSSSLRASQLDDVTAHPERVMNIHFYQPVWEKRMVELMGGSSTTREVLERALRFAESLELLPLVVRRESTGFIVNRVWRAVKSACLRLVAEGVTTPADVDRGWMILNQVDIGPFARMDRVGLDVVLAIEETYYRESGRREDAPPQLLYDMVARGDLGMKTGRGFYSYPHPEYEDVGFLGPAAPDAEWRPVSGK